MTKQTKSFASFFLLLFFCIQASILSAQNTTTYSKDVRTKIKQFENNLGLWVQIENQQFTLADRMKSNHVNGVSIALIKDYKIEWAKGYGWADSAKQRPVTINTLFQAGSISKSLNGVGILNLAQEGKLNLDSDINIYLKSWKFPYDSLSKGKKITIANLLSHTAGLTVHGFDGYEKGDTIPTLIQILNGEKPANNKAIRSMYEPSLKSEYSGGGTTISQLILQDVTGQPYDTYMWNNVLNPMGMNNSFYAQPPPADKENLLAKGYYNDGKEVKGKYHIYPEQAAAGLWTNPTDLAKYIIETQLSLHGKSNKILSPETTRLRLTPYIDSSAALGVFIIKKGSEKYFNHDGWDEGFVASYYGSMENGNGVVVMANTDNGSLLSEIVNSLAAVYKWKDFYTPKIKKVVAVNNEILKSYVGNYKLHRDTLNVTLEKEGLVIRLNSKTKYKIYFTSDSDFFILEIAGSEQRFTKDENKKVNGFEINGNGYKMQAVKIE
ncbi:serine hydrolase domain-containing protein [Chitinophaga ginsengisoli]|uniref:CubicO group peptidase (Beta-lactamase class C family) n=1 Tax=Chitinophaga ginsengisoli TaxID=363837 RepID=A0A2P8GKN6_9BACT|nr:serine hydrolase domain-containing protein [Chitinophaga ginsengisoli]PSL34523.1 CubicO group peptidase (beta-lactamase class C family) [Chitinophaga ginsengisoli]